MVKIYVEKGTRLKDINKIIQDMLITGEKPQGRFMALCRIPMMFCQGYAASVNLDKNDSNKIFHEHAAEYIVVPTNKRLLLFGISDIDSCISGIRQIEYDEITSFLFEDMRLKLQLSKGSYYDFDAYYNYLDDKYAMLAINAIDCIINKLGEEKMFIYQLKLSTLALWILIIFIISMVIRLSLMNMGI